MSVDPILIFVMIGAGNWAVHIIQCAVCTGFLRGGLDFFLEGIVFVFGWPISLISFITHIFTKPETLSTNITPDDIVKLANDAVEKAWAQKHEGGVILKREPNESDEAFVARTVERLREIERNRS